MHMMISAFCLYLNAWQILSSYTVRTNAQKKNRAVGQTNFINGPKQLNLPNARGALLEAMVFSIVAGDT